MKDIRMPTPFTTSNAEGQISIVRWPKKEREEERKRQRAEILE